MGSVVAYSDKLKIQASVIGTAPLESLQLFQGKEIIAEVRPSEFENLTASNQIRISWQGSRERGRQRRATWDGVIKFEGCEVVSADTVSFDVPADGILSQTKSKIQFASKTTGDRDGLDIVLNDAQKGTVIFDSPLGTETFTLADLTDDNPRKTFDFGGVDLQLMIERYPATVAQHQLELDIVVEPPQHKRTPYFIKATQTDGQMAWASPIYVEN